MKKNDLKTFGQINLVIFFGIVVITNVFVGFGIGYFIYSLTNNKLWLILMLFLGMISGLYNGIKELLKEAKKYDEIGNDTKRDDKKNNSSNNN